MNVLSNLGVDIVQHSIIVRVFRRIFEFIKKYYGFSYANKIFNSISNTLKRFFVNSLIYSLFINENRNARNILRHSLVGRSEGLFQKLLSFLNPLYKRGVQGSFVLKRQTSIKRNRKGVIRKLVSLIIIGAVLSYNLLSIMNRSFYLEQIYISTVILVLIVNVYFIDINGLYKNSLMKRILDGIFHM